MASFECSVVNDRGQQCNYDVHHTVHHIHFMRAVDGRPQWVEWDTRPPERPCVQAWHMGLKLGILHECVRTEAIHRIHRNAADDMRWSGKLTEEEHELANALRGLS